MENAEGKFSTLFQVDETMESMQEMLKEMTPEEAKLS